LSHDARALTPEILLGLTPHVSNQERTHFIHGGTCDLKHLLPRFPMQGTHCAPTILHGFAFTL
jgi:hypothetical protein